MLNTQKGQYQGNFIGRFADGLVPELSRFIYSNESSSIFNLFDEILELLSGELAERNFQGPFCIDAFLYRAQNGDIALKPIVEINPRYSMGRVALEVNRFVATGCSSLFTIFSAKDLKKTSFVNLKDFVESLEQAYPIERKGKPLAKLTNGVIALTEVKEDSQFVAVLAVAKKKSELMAMLGMN